MGKVESNADQLKVLREKLRTKANKRRKEKANKAKKKKESNRKDFPKQVKLKTA
jgi:hypothetical protein